MCICLTLIEESSCIKSGIYFLDNEMFITHFIPAAEIDPFQHFRILFRKFLNSKMHFDFVALSPV